MNFSKPTGHRLLHAVAILCWMGRVTFGQSCGADSVTIGQVETLMAFDRQVEWHTDPPPPPYTYRDMDTPASIVLDSHNNGYMSLGFSGNICKVNVSGAGGGSGCEWKVHLPIFDPDPVTNCTELPGPFPWPVVLGVAIEEDDDGYIYAAANACSAENHGVWRVNTTNGDAALFRRVPHGRTFSPEDPQTCRPGGGIVVNGLATRGGFVYAADYFCFRIWRIAMHDGDGEGVAAAAAARPWSDDPLMQSFSSAPWPGPNGLRFHGDDLYVSLSGGGKILRFANATTAQEGKADVHAHLPFHPCCDAGDTCAPLEERLGAALPGNQSIDICDYPMGCDEFDFDKEFEKNGMIVCTTDPYGVLVLLDPREVDVATQVLLDGRHPEEGAALDGPTSAAFGRTPETRSKLYITNGAFPILPPPTGDRRNPSLMVVDVEISQL